MSVSIATHNPRGRDHDLTAVEIEVSLADHLGTASIPEGTPIYFATDGGAIAPSCTTDDTGVCSVQWRSQDPRPLTGPGVMAAVAVADPLGSGDTIVGPGTGGTGYPSSGRANILIWTAGVETFNDINGNGQFDDGDIILDDLAEPFIDKNEDGNRDDNVTAAIGEEFVNYPIPTLGQVGTYDGPDGLYSGPNCAHTTDCVIAPAANIDRTFIFENRTIAMSSDSVCIVPVGPSTGSYYPTTTHPPTALTTTHRFRFLVHDCYGNPPMNGTTVTFTLDGDAGELRGPTSFTIGNTTVDMGYAVTGTLAAGTDTLAAGTRERYPTNSLVYFIDVAEKTDNNDPESGRVEITVDPPAGSNSDYDFVELSDGADDAI
jgi:hypothetical protein